jgi:hypothetical protein
LTEKLVLDPGVFIQYGKGCEQRGLTFCNAALSKPEHTPTKRSQDAIIPVVPPLVSSQLLGPITAVLFRDMAVVAVRAAMPETSINENSDFRLGKREVRPSLERTVSTPACNAECFQEFNKGLFGRTIVPRTDSAHYKRSLLFGKHVH